MKSRFITFEEEAVRAEAEKYLISSCGLNRKGSRFQKMKRESFSLRDDIKDSITIRGVMMQSFEFTLSKNILTISGVPFRCNAFERINFSDVSIIYAFVITSGEQTKCTESITKLFYGDIWGTSYVEGGRMALAQFIREENPEKFVSDSFGPGFFGMPIEDIESFFKLLDCGEAGIYKQENGTMMPGKSLAGIFLVMEKECDWLIGDCASCIGDAGGCQFCRLFQHRG